ncbi:MAG: nuclear transport factor 2 family protein [Sphingomonadales bacterium]|nr:MAG: nuclear transport factor 2 family protein [Sphingomonadales bacterium]
MSDPVALYMQLLHAMRSPDNSIAVQHFAPDFVAYEDPGMPYGGVVRGGANFLRLRGKVYDAWGSGCLKLQYVTGDPEGGHAAAHFNLVGKPNGATETVEGNVVVVWAFRDDLATEARVYYFDTPRLAKALADSGYQYA